MVAQDQIPLAISVFECRGARLTHACQYSDLESYLALGGIPSRALLESTSSYFTAFDTDQVDRVNDVWDKVFFNLGDFGDWFARGKQSLPNPYGPITLVFNCSALESALDFSVCLRSAGAKNFNREQEGLSVQELSQIFVDYDGPTRHVKFTSQLKKLFPERIVTSSPEMSVSYSKQLAGFDALRFVLVDNYPDLPRKVQHLFRSHGSNVRICERRTSAVRKETYRQLWGFISNGILTLDEILDQADLGDDLKEWCMSVKKWDTKSFHFNRYARYLFRGTIVSAK